MPSSIRFQTAVEKLYKAFHSDHLHPECYQQCAVGNICDQRDFWRHFTDDHGSNELNYVGRVHQLLGRTYQGYTPQELIEIEAAFLEGCGYSLPLRFQSKNNINPHDKNVHFEGLCAAIQKLCELDKMKDPFDISTLFDYTPQAKTSHLVAM